MTYTVHSRYALETHKNDFVSYTVYTVIYITCYIYDFIYSNIQIYSNGTVPLVPYDDDLYRKKDCYMFL